MSEPLKQDNKASCEDPESVCVGTCVDTQQPGANQRGERLAGFGQQGNHPEEECRGGLLTTIDHKVLVHQIRYHQLQQLARPLCEHPVTGRRRRRVTARGAVTASLQGPHNY